MIFCVFFTVGGMSRPPKPVAQVKKVAPPAVPEAGFRHSGSSFGSAGYSSAGEDHVFHEQGRGKDILVIFTLTVTVL